MYIIESHMLLATLSEERISQISIDKYLDSW